MEYSADDLRRMETKIDELLALIKAQQALTPERSHRHHQQLQLKFNTVGTNRLENFKDVLISLLIFYLKLADTSY
jgi:hypothetical protein